MKADFSRVRLAVLVTDGISNLPFDKLVREVVAGGADCIQLREKTLSDEALLERARICREIGRDCIFIVNDRPDIALLSEADGVHVGPEDTPVAEARRIVGDNVVVGASAYSVPDIKSAEDAGADYIGVGAAFPTETKDAQVTGLTLISEAARISRIPFIAIGGINHGNVASVIRAGARGVAVCSAIISAADPRRATEEMKAAIVAGGGGQGEALGGRL